MNEITASQTTHWLNRFRMALVVLLPLSALLTPKDPSVYLSIWDVAAVTLYTLGCLSILCGDFLRTKWKIAGYSLLFYIPLKTLKIRLFWLNNSISSFDDWVLSGIYFIGIFWLIYLIASVEELIIAVIMKERFDPFRKSIFCKSQR